jgi:uncharacterized protein (DUF1330 family)
VDELQTGWRTARRSEGGWNAGLPVREIEVQNPSGLAPYRAAVEDTITKFGGRFLVRGRAAKLKEGDREPKYIVIVEFPDTGALEQWWNSSEYQQILPFRLENTTGRLFTVEGVSS